MNSQEVTMNNEPPNSNLIATEKAIHAAADAIALASRVPAPLKSIADQVIRSASSVPADCEVGHGRRFNSAPSWILRGSSCPLCFK